MTLPAIIVTVALALGAGSLAAQQSDTASGTLQDSVASSTDPTQTFAFFYPTGYDSTKSWPVLFAMDPRAHAMSPLTRLRAAADRYGYVIVSSYRTQSDSAPNPNEAAFNAMYAETGRRVRMDRHRVYLVGFSGTARVAWDFAYRLADHAAGILGAGASLPTDWVLVDPPVGGPAPVFFGTIGNADFNYEEVLGVDSLLDRTSVRHHVAVFTGPHSWPPDSLMLEGVEWFELQAMRTGLKPTVPAWVDSLYGARLELGRSLEAAGDSFAAWRRYRLTVGDFDGLHETSTAAEQAARLQRTQPVKSALKQQRKNADQATEYLDALRFYLTKVRISVDPPGVESSLKDLKIRQLQRQAESDTDTLAVQAARRVLLNTFVTLASYEASDALRENKPARALALLDVANAIRPGLASVCAKRKRAMGMMGQDTSEAAQPCPATGSRSGSRQGLVQHAYRVAPAAAVSLDRLLPPGPGG